MARAVVAQGGRGGDAGPGKIVVPILARGLAPASRGSHPAWDHSALAVTPATGPFEDISAGPAPRFPPNVAQRPVGFKLLTDQRRDRAVPPPVPVVPPPELCLGRLVGLLDAVVVIIDDNVTVAVELS